MKRKVIYSHHLLCSSCNFKFQIETEEPSNLRIGVDKMKCPICGSPIQLDPALLYTSLKPSTKTQGRWNIEMSKVALEMASKHKREDAERGIDQEVLVTSHQEGSEGKQLKIPKKVIESIKEKISPALK